MILFKPYHVPMILLGIKTETRRIWKRNRANVGSIQQARIELFGEPFAYLKITKRYKQKLGDMSYGNVIREGYVTELKFRYAWEEINGLYNPNLIVDVVRFFVFKEDTDKK